MATNRNNNRNTQNNRANNKRISSDNEEQLELIKINVDKVKKDVTEVSVHTRKEISAITKKVDELITKLEQSMKLSASQSSKQAAEMLKQQNIMVSTANKLLDVSNKTLENEKKTTQQKKEQVKQQENITDAWLADRQQSKDNTNMILDAIKGKGSFSNVMLSNNNKAKDDIINRMRTIESSTSLSVGEKRSMMNELTNQFNSLDKSAGKIQAAATTMDTSVKVVKIFLNTWMDRFNDGMNKIVNTYESTYSQQAVQTNMNQKEYFDKQREMQDSLNKQGLQNNVAISDVMQATSNFVSNGITNMSQAMQLGEQSAIAKTLAPYLDTQSEAFMSMSQTLGPQFSKSLIGVSKYVSDNVGSNRFIQKNMNQIVSMMEPIVMASNKQLMGDEEWAQIESLMNNGYTESEALALVSEAMDVIRNPYGAITNGTTLQKMQVANGNYTDVSKYISGKLSDTASMLNGTSGLARSAAAETIGAGYKGYLTSDEQLRKQARVASQFSNEDALGSGGATTSGSQSSYRTKMQNFANDQYTTAKEQKDILAENLALEYAIANEKWPDLMKAIKEIVPAIAGMFATYVGGKLLGKVGGNLLGLGGKSGGSSLISSAGTYIGSGLANGFSNAAPTAMGAGKIGAFTGTAGALAGAAGVAAGGAMAVKGGMDVYNDFKNNDITWKTGASAGGAVAGAAGAGALIALGASNPIGWVALGVGALALGARKVR